MEMASNQPGRNIQLFGIMTSDRSLLGRTIPLTSEALKQSAFVQAEYNASIDPSVRIRFINRDVSKQSAVSTPLNQVAVNLVRTALQSYIQEKGSPPTSIESLTADYPDNYLSIIPGEAVTGITMLQPVLTARGDGCSIRAQDRLRICSIRTAWTSSRRSKFPMNL